MSNKKYHGVVIPAITPLKADNSLDAGSVEKLFQHYRRHGAQPFILGTSGEAQSLPSDVKEKYIHLAGRLKQPDEQLYVGISSNCLADSVDWAKLAFDRGADVVVCTLPSYYPLTEFQVARYFEMLADQVIGPLMIYNIPSTTHYSIPLSIIDKLSHHPNIVGTKDSERNEERLVASLKLWSGRPDFSHLLGWSARSGYSLLNGGDGLVPSTGNLAPAPYCALYKAAVAGDQEKVAGYQATVDELGQSYQTGHTLGESLAALKALMYKEGLCEPFMMPPL